MILCLVGAGCSNERLAQVSNRCPRPAVGEVRVVGLHGQRRLSATDWYPQKALDLGWQGDVELRCDVARRKATNCAIVNEQPARFGFGAAAMKEAKMLDAPRGSDGVGVPLRYRWTFIDRGCRRNYVTDQGLITTVTSKAEPDVEPSDR